MTNQEIIDYYANLLILQYKGKPKAYAMIQTVVTPVIMDQLPTQVMNAYNLVGDNLAVGKQLDVLAKYVGVSRMGSGFSGPITLDDDNFRILIQMGIIRNFSGSALSDIVGLIYRFFGSQILVFDYQNMQMSYLISSAIGSQDLVQMFITQGLLPKPMGVGLSTVIYTPTIDSFFGMGSYEIPAYDNKPFNTYEDYQFDWPWLKYQDSIYGGLVPTLYDLVTEDGDSLVTEDGDGLLVFF